MKISVGVLCLLAVCFVVTAFQSAKWGETALPEWVTCQVDNQFSALLPTQPTEMDMMNVFTSQGLTPTAEQAEKIKSMKILTATDGVGNYMITRAPTGTESGISQPSDRAAFYVGAVNGLLQNERGKCLFKIIN